MSKYNKINRLDEKAISIIADYFLYDYGQYFDLQFHGVKDNTPDTDGFIRLRKPLNTEENSKKGSRNLNQVVFFQLKGFGKIIKDHSYKCDKDLFDFCKEINLPTILLVVSGLDSENKEDVVIYWYYFNNANIRITESINSKENKKEIKIPNLSLLKNVKVDNAKILYKFIQDLAGRNYFIDLPKELLELSIDYKDNLVIVTGAIYLIGEIEKSDFKDIFTLLQVEEKAWNDCLSVLSNKDLIHFSNTRSVIFKGGEDEFNRNKGMMMLYECVELIDFNRLVNIYRKKHDKLMIIFKHLGAIEHVHVNSFCEKKADVVLKLIDKKITNNYILEELQLLKCFCLKVPLVSFEIIEKILNVWKKQKNKRVNINTKKIIEEIFSIILELWYLNPTKKIINMIFNNLDIFKRNGANIKVFFSRVAKFNLYDVNYKRQTILLDKIRKIDIKNNFDLIRIIIKEIFKEHIEFMREDTIYKISYHQYNLFFNDNLLEIRFNFLNYIIYLLNNKILTNKQKEDIIIVLKEIKLFENEAILVLDFYTKNLLNLDNIIIRAIEEHLDLLRRNFIDNKKIKNEIKKIEKLIDKKNGYLDFKTLYGFDVEFDRMLDVEDSIKARNQRIDYLVNKKNFDELKSIISEIVKHSNELGENRGEFEGFNKFLYELGLKRPEVAQRIINENEEELEVFLIHLISGIWKSSEKDLAKKIIKKWVKKGNYLRTSAYIFRYVNEIDEELLDLIYKKAQVKNDFDALKLIITSIVHNFNNGNLGKKLFVDIICILNKNNRYDWIDVVWYRGNSLLNKLNIKDWDRIMEGLIACRKMSYYWQEFLLNLAKKNPRKIINFLQKRVEYNKKLPHELKDFKDSYFVFPFELERVKPFLQKQIVIKELKKWFNKGNDWYFWASELLEDIFPINNGELKEFLLELSKSKKKKDNEILFEILGRYEVEYETYELLKIFIENHPNSKKDWDRINNILSRIHSFRGEYGQVDIYNERLAIIKKWKIVKNKDVKLFARKHEEYLLKRIDYEKKVADDSVIRMKMNFN
ncbi:MAG TPA: hypothetical protein PKU93_00535 [Candidatus Pacearchaeota archaeon]|nr:hypothetical protein [Candidatus Pacearchaeota archaeon]